MAALLGSQVMADQPEILSQSFSLNQDFASFDEDGGLGESGAQAFTRLQFTTAFEDFDLGFATGLVGSDRDSPLTGGSGSVSTLTDTVVSGTYRAFAGDVDWLGGRRATLAFNADINIPTGQEQLTGDEKNAVFDSFLVDLDRFGEGWNTGIGASATVTLSETLLLGVAASYTFRGEFSPDGNAPDRVLDPGDQAILALQVLNTEDNLEWSLGYRMIDEQETKVDGQAVYDRSLSHEVFGSLAYQVDDLWTVRASGHYATRGADESLDIATGNLVQSPEDDNGDSYFLSLGAVRSLTPEAQLSVDLSRRYRGTNEFDEADFAFEPWLARDELAVGYARSLDANSVLSVGASIFQVEEGPISGFDGPRFEGFTLSLGIERVF
jgi:hypothetical protein